MAKCMSSTCPQLKDQESNTNSMTLKSLADMHLTRAEIVDRKQIFQGPSVSCITSQETKKGMISCTTSYK